MSYLLRRFYDRVILPKSADPDSRRREFILNVLLTGTMVASVVSAVAASVNVYSRHGRLEPELLMPIAGFCALVGLLIWQSRKGRYVTSAVLLVGMVFTVATYLLVSWSFVLPSAPVTFVIAIVLAGVLFRASAALWVSGAAALEMLGIGSAQVNGLLHPYTGWLNHSLDLVDVVANALVFGVIGLVTWLANRQIDQALERARDSEHALAVERDSLEVKVVERTRELKAAQMQRIIELQRLSEYGRMGMSLLHDVANPLTAASLNLEQLDRKHEPDLVKQISKSVHNIERYVEAARKRLKHKGEVVRFSVYDELGQVTSIIKHRAHEMNVQIRLDKHPTTMLTGDPVAFNQLIANLLINAIEAYDDTPTQKRLVAVSYTKQGRWVTMQIRDWGKGIADSDQAAIFEPFFSTKSHATHNMGIGLSMVKRSVEQDFGGAISVTSSTKQGTCFTIRFQDQKENNATASHSSKPTISTKSTSSRRRP